MRQIYIKNIEWTLIWKASSRGAIPGHLVLKVLDEKCLSSLKGNKISSVFH